MRMCGRAFREKLFNIGGAAVAFSDGSENARLLLHTIRHTMDFSGRARRAEVIYYWIAITLFGVVASFAIMTSFPVIAGMIATSTISLVLQLPAFALFARRLHDQARSGWWTLMVAASFLFDIYETARFAANPYPSIEGQHLLTWTDSILKVAVLILSLLPGTDGPNRYGADPRLAE